MEQWNVTRVMSSSLVWLLSAEVMDYVPLNLADNPEKATLVE